MLEDLCGRAPGARGAVLCDFEGEFVELVVRDPQITDYDMKILGAQMAAAWLNLQNGANERGAGGAVEMRLGCSGGTLLCRGLRDGYYVVLLISQGSSTGQAAFELREAATRLSSEI